MALHRRTRRTPKRVAALVAQLTDDIPIDPPSGPPNKRRAGCSRNYWTGIAANKASCWEYYRLADMDDESLLDERAAWQA